MAAAALPRRPGLVQDAQAAVGQVAERERTSHPHQQARGRQSRCGRKKQSRKTQRHGSANKTAASHTACHEWRYNLSPQRTSHGSTTASMLRLSKSTAPKAASVTPYC